MMRRRVKPVPNPLGTEEVFKLELEMIDRGLVDLIQRRLEVIRKAEACEIDLNSEVCQHETMAFVLRYANAVGAPCLIVDAAFLLLSKVMRPSEKPNA